MINSIHGKFAKVVSLPGEKTAINKRDWLGFFSENKKKNRRLTKGVLGSSW